MVYIERQWIYLASVIWGEVNKKRKNRYHILTHRYMNSRKAVQMSRFAGQKETQMKRMDIWTWMGEGRTGQTE